MNLSSSAQAGQDTFAFEMCGRKTDGTFLDVGSYNVATCNNSFALERVGWRGLMVDLFKDDENLPNRTSPFLQADTTKLFGCWLNELDLARLPHHLDYLSLDVDDATLATLVGMPLPYHRGISFDVITIEHDAYRVGPQPREGMRFILKGCGYDMICADVKIGGQPFEDWWIYPGAVSQELVDLVRCEGKEFSEIIALLNPAAGV